MYIAVAYDPQISHPTVIALAKVDGFGDPELIRCGFTIFEQAPDFLNAVADADQNWVEIWDTFKHCFPGWLY
jgi:hypothetical protein